jgi:hypothetical protein
MNVGITPGALILGFVCSVSQVKEGFFKYAHLVIEIDLRAYLGLNFTLP